MSKVWLSGLSSVSLPSAALMPPWAAPEWLRTGWTFVTSATSAPASCAAMAARIPARPAPTTTTSWLSTLGNPPARRPSRTEGLPDGHPGSPGTSAPPRGGMMPRELRRGPDPARHPRRPGRPRGRALSPALTILGGLVILLVAGVVDAGEAFSGFSNSAPLTVAALYVLAAAAGRSRVLELAVSWLPSRSNAREPASAAPSPASSCPRPRPRRSSTTRRSSPWRSRPCCRGAGARAARPRAS